MPPSHDGGTPSPLPRLLLSFSSTNLENSPRPRSRSCLTGITSTFHSASATINSDKKSPQLPTLPHRRGLTSIALPTLANLDTKIKSQSTIPHTSPIKIQTPLHSSSGASYFASQPGASGLEARSPANKRPPASRSSHGVETSNGPPPALSTQRSHSNDSAWRILPPINTVTFGLQLTPRALATLDAENLTNRYSSDQVNQDTDAHTNSVQGAALLTNVLTSPGSADDGVIAGFPQLHNDQCLILDERTNHKVQNYRDTMSTNYVSSLESEIRRSSNDKERLSQSSQEDLFHDTKSQGDQSILIDREGEERQAPRSSKINTSPKKSTTPVDDVKPYNITRERLSQSSQEDIFLDIANTEANSEDRADIPGSNERPLHSHSPPANHRKSMSYEIGTSFELTPSPAVNTHKKPQRSSLEHEPVNPERDQQRPSLNSPSPPQTFYKPRHYSASAHPLDQHHRPRLSNGTRRAPLNSSRGAFNHESSPEYYQNSSRRVSVAESSTGIPPKSYKLSNLSHATNGQQDLSSPVVRSFPRAEHETSNTTPRAEGTMSTVSTNAPSTLWDEIDDLRTRLKRLELIGKMPDSSGAAISVATGERPATATTTMTTMSSSPKHDHDAASVSPEASVIDGLDDSTAQRLLTSALANSKPTISPALYRTLEATVTDTIEMAKFSSNVGTTRSVPNGIDKQLRRKAINMCRSLTELCISLTNKPESLYNTPISRPTNGLNLHQQRISSVDGRRFQREGSVDADPDPSLRTLSRVEARRSSMLGSSFTSPTTSTALTTRERALDLTTPTQEYPSPSSVVSRTSTALERIRRPSDSNGETASRSVSRAMTEVGSTRPSPSSRHRQLPSREYFPPRSPSVASSLPRRSYFSVPAELPSTPLQASNRRYLGRSTPLSADAAWAKEVKQRMTSASGYEGLDLRRQRAGSVGERMQKKMRQGKEKREKGDEEDG